MTASDWTDTVATAEGLPLTPTSTQQAAAAPRVTARNADSKEDLVLLLDVLGLPGDDDTLTALLPLVNSSEADPDMPEQHYPTFQATDTTPKSTSRSSPCPSPTTSSSCSTGRLRTRPRSTQPRRPHLRPPVLADRAPRERGSTARGRREARQGQGRPRKNCAP